MQRAIPFIVFVIVLGLARVLGSVTPESFGNLQPFGALFFCGMALFGWRGVILPAIAWLITVPLTSAAQGYSWDAQVLIPIIGFAIMIGLAARFKNATPGKVFLGSLAGAVVFYLVTNSLSWAFDPQYAPKSLVTLGQALWTGLPQYQIPTWAFFRNAMVAQTIFSAIYLYATRTVSASSLMRTKAITA